MVSVCQTEGPSLIDSANLRSGENATHLGSPDVDIFPMAIERRFITLRRNDCNRSGGAPSAAFLSRCALLEEFTGRREVRKD
jgi:hypothetical protein